MMKLHRPTECIHGFPLLTDCALCADKGGAVFGCNHNPHPAVPVEALRRVLNDRFSGEGELRGRINELIDQARGGSEQKESDLTLNDVRELMEKSETEARGDSE